MSTPEAERRKTRAPMETAASDELALLAFDSSAAGLLVVDQSGRIAATNQRVRDLFGYDSDEFGTLSFSDLVDADVLEIHRAWVERMRPAAARRVSCVRKDRTTFNCEISLRRAVRGEREWTTASVIVASTDEQKDHISAGVSPWRTFLESLGQHLWFWDLSTDAVELSAGWVASLGYSAEEIRTGDQWFNLVHPADRTHIANASADCIQGKSDLLDEEFRIRGRDGQYRWVQSVARVGARSANGTPLRMIGTYRDIHLARTAQEKLAASELRWKFALEGARAGVWDWDLKSGEVYFSPQWKRMIGFDDSELEPTIETWRELCLPDDLAISDDAIAHYIAGETDEYRAECRIRTKDGTVKWVLDRGTIVERDIDGTPLRMIGTHDDITEAKALESELRESRAQVESVAALVPGMVFQYKRYPDGRESLPYASGAVDDVYGLAPGTFNGDAAALTALIHPEDRDRVDRSLQESARTLDQWDQEYRIVVNGDTRWLHGVANPLKESAPDGAVVWHGHISEITERKKSDIMLAERTRDLEIANSDLEQFNYVASHDLKEPLRGIKHLASWIEEELGDDTPESVHKNLDRLHARVRRLQLLIDDLSAYSRASRGDVTVTQVVPRELVADLVDDIELHGARIVFTDLSEEAFQTSEVALRTVLKNLLVNAIVHHDRPEIGRIALSSETHPEYVRFAVEDDGPGIAPEHHERIFKIYQRLNPERYADGSGSGLAIVRRILTRIDSSIELVSPLTERGSRFSFNWPRRWPQE